MLLHETGDGGSRPFSSLIKGHLNYDPESQTFRVPRNYNTAIPFLHGATIGSMGRLAEAGVFTRSNKAGSLDEFYMNVNPDYEKIAEIGLDPAHVKLIKSLGVSALEVAIGYATNNEEDTLSDGVVVAVKYDVLRCHKHSVFFGENEGREVPEIAIPEAPELSMIQGIYPVNEDAAVELRATLQQIK